MTVQTPTWKESIKAFVHPKVITMLFLGFSAGLPILLIFSSLSVWLTEAGVKKSVVTYFSWAALGYSFKFVWAPLIDRLSIPLVSRVLGRRRSWLLLTQLMVIVAICWMASTDPVNGSDYLTIMAFAAVLLGFSSASQDVVIDAYRIESAEPRMQALVSATYIAGYRIGMIVAGAGALLIASHYGSTADHYDYHSWQKTYFWMAAFMMVGVMTTLIISEPKHNDTNRSSFSANQNVQLVLVFAICVSGFVGWFVYSSHLVADMKSALSLMLSNKSLSSLLVETIRLALGVLVAATLAWFCSAKLNLVEQKVVQVSYLEPVKEFFVRHGVGLSILILCIVGLYRTSDIVLGVISNVFYLDMGYSKNEIAYAVKTFGVIMSIAGGFLGGILAFRMGVFKILLLGGVLASLTNLLFILLAQNSSEMWLFYTVVGVDNLSAGLASAAFVAFLSSLTNISFTAVQYAIFSSLMTLIPKSIGGYSGSMVESIGYTQFFTITALMGVPVLILLYLIKDKLDFNPVEIRNQ